MFKIKFYFLLLLLLTSSFTVFSQTKDWKQYSSAMAGFKVNYPSDWRIGDEEAKGQVWRLTINSPGERDDDVWEHNSITICSKPKKDSFENLDRCAEHHLSIRNNKVVSEETFTLNGMEIRKVETKEPYPNSRSIFFNVFFSTKDRDFQVSGIFRKIFNLERFVPVFDQILATIQPLQEISALTYKNEKYDFAVTYPVSWKSCPTVNTNQDEEVILMLIPEGIACNGGNYILVSRMTKFSYEKNNRDLKEFLKDKVYSKTVPYVEFGNIHAAMGEKSDEKYVWRERYFYTNYPQTYELLKISEMYELKNEKYQAQAREILASARRFLKFNN